MIVLGIDPGLASTGWAVVQKKEPPILLAYGCFKTSADQSLAPRLARIGEEIQKLARLYRPQVLAVEEIFFAKNVKTALKIGQSLGVIKMVGARLGLTVAEFTPLNIKMTLTGYGRADKNQVEFMLQKCLNLTTKIKPNHAADAVAVALTYLFTNERLK
ncbi:MAG: crossover junction endodeoxyribonuclease RuvC [Candidatus Shapirobacteria bacterium]